MVDDIRMDEGKKEGCGCNGGSCGCAKKRCCCKAVFAGLVLLLLGGTMGYIAGTKCAMRSMMCPVMHEGAMNHGAPPPPAPVVPAN